MDVVLRAVALYGFLLLLFRAAGKRTLAQTTVFDLVLLFVIGEMAAPAVLGSDESWTGAGVAIVSLVAMDVVLSLVKQRSPRIDRWIDGVPVHVMREGRPDEEVMARERVDVEDVLSAARQHHGVEDLGRIQAAVLERGGQISVIPR